MLQFDSDSCIRSLVQRLIQVMDSLMSEFYRDATQSLSAEGKADSELIKAVYDEAKEMIEAKCKFYAQAIMESFGTGSKADMSADAYWKEYEAMGADETGLSTFNPKRRERGNAYISGRPQGEYRNIFGEVQESGGRNAGRSIEYIKITDKNGNEIQVRPMTPKFSIQNAEAWIIRDTETKVERRIKMEIEKFFAEEGSKFFVYTG